MFLDSSNVDDFETRQGAGQLLARPFSSMAAKA
jgi:hypothetical protein